MIDIIQIRCQLFYLYTSARIKAIVQMLAVGDIAQLVGNYNSSANLRINVTMRMAVNPIVNV